jgi:hypothetical protein
MHKIGLFVDSNGNKAQKKDVFEAFIFAVNADIQNYDNLLSADVEPKTMIKTGSKR